MYLDWEPLGVHLFDCVANCFCLLRYASRETCLEIAKRSISHMNKDGIMIRGITNDEIQSLLEVYGSTMWTLLNSSDKPANFSIEEINDKIDTVLEINMATIAYIHTIDERDQFYGHCFVVIKDIHNNNIVVDPQVNNAVIPLERYLLHKLRKPNIIYKCGILGSFGRIHGDYYKVTIPVLDRVIPNGPSETTPHSAAEQPPTIDNMIERMRQRTTKSVI